MKWCLLSPERAFNSEIYYAIRSSENHLARITALCQNGSFGVTAGDAAFSPARAKCTEIKKIFWATR